MFQEAPLSPLKPPVFYLEELRSLVMNDLPIEIEVKQVFRDGVRVWEAAIRDKGWIRWGSTATVALGLLVREFAEDLGFKIKEVQKENAEE